jgi:hypothetical protein
MDCRIYLREKREALGAIQRMDGVVAMQRVFWTVAFLATGALGTAAQTQSTGADGDWAIGRWEGHTYSKGSRTRMDASEVVLIVERSAGGKLTCRMNQPATIDKAPSTLEHCDIRSDGVRLTSLGKNRYDLQREGKTLKGNATTPKGGVFEAELNHKR